MRSLNTSRERTSRHLDMDLHSASFSSLSQPNSRVVQRFITLAGLLVFSVSAEAASRPPKKSVLVLYGERGDPLIIRAIKQNLWEVFHASASREIDLFSEYCGCACVLLRSCIIYFPVL